MFGNSRLPNRKVLTSCNNFFARLDFKLITLLSQSVFGAQMQTRKLHVHEYQSQQIMAQFGVRVARGGVASTPEEAERVAKELGAHSNPYYPPFVAPLRVNFTVSAL